MVPRNPFLLSAWPHALVHIDGDAFFASCEQSVHPEYRGKVVITGAERNIVASMSYEAKARGIKRGVPLWAVRKRCPDAIIVPSDYETYSLISKRMFAIMRRFSPAVEESSIDEGYADLGGLRRMYRLGYAGIAEKMQQTIERELGLSVSLGLSVTKTLAKLAAKYKKPHGFTAVPGNRIHLFLANIPVSDVCGIGPQTTSLLAKHAIRTAYAFACADERWIEHLLGKIGIELWHELRGCKMYGLNTEEKKTYQSISKSKTFTPPSGEYAYVKAQLFRNIESAFIKLRRYRLRAKRIVLYLKKNNFQSSAVEFDLNRASLSPMEVLPFAEKIFARMFDSHTTYRATGVVLTRLEVSHALQYELFEDPVRMVKMADVAHAIDAINKRYGKHTVCQGTGAYLSHAKNTRSGQSCRHLLPVRKQNLLKGETVRRRIRIPLWQIRV